VIVVVIPCYRVVDHVVGVLARIGPEVQKIYCVDDHCPDHSGDFILQNTKDPRVQVLTHAAQQGVGGATLTGYKQALRDKADIIVKLDGDGQMDPAYIPILVSPILAGNADYAKGNRFYQIEDLQQMPGLRLLGNAVLSFFSKISTGYWDIFDPTNGYTAIQAKVLALLPLEKISRSYYYESDILFRLNTVRAVVTDIPMKAIYGSESSHLNIMQVIPEFLNKHISNFAKRIFYVHFLRSFDLASLYFLTGIPLFLFGFTFGCYRWIHSQKDVAASPGIVMLAGLPLLLGIQFLLSFFHHDMQDVPRQPIHTRL